MCEQLTGLTLWIRSDRPGAAVGLRDAAAAVGHARRTRPRRGRRHRRAADRSPRGGHPRRSGQAHSAALEQLLDTIQPHEGLHEERNYRLPLELRTQLDDLSAALEPGPRRSDHSSLGRS
jgi:hypothetical protein